MLADFLKREGGLVRKEVVVPEWTQLDPVDHDKINAAVLDVERVDNVGKKTYFDAVAFHPFTGNGLVRSSSCPSHHEKRKHKRYPERDSTGARVGDFSLVPVAMSTLGSILAFSARNTQLLSTETH